MSYLPNKDRPLTTACPYFPEDEVDWLRGELADILHSRLSMGEKTAEFERKFSDYCSPDVRRHGIAVPSGTAALGVALRCLFLGAGDEVLVPCQTFIATAVAVCLVGATPVVTEIDPKTLNMDFEDALSKITPKTRAVIIVHFGGSISPNILYYIDKVHLKGLHVVEDAAHAHGATLNNRKAGTFGDLSCFSFYSLF